MASRAVVLAGVVIFLAGLTLGYGVANLTRPDVEDTAKYRELQTENQRFRTYVTCVPPFHEEEKPAPDTWVHYHYDEERNLTAIEIETTRRQDSPAWSYLPEGHPGMSFPHWALHVWFTDPETVCPNMEDLIRRLRAEGLTVEEGGDIEQPFFSVKGRLLHVGGEDLQIFVYGDSVSAIKEAALISPDASTIGSSKVDWVSKPHFYAVGKMTVLYVGDDAKMKQILEKIVGPQFAGR